MPSGQTHDRLTWYASQAIIPARLIASLQNGPITTQAISAACLTTAIASIGCVVSGLWLSPDVDSMGYLKRRYGALRLLWMPYYKVCRMGGNYRVRGVGTHRSHLSHTPIVGGVSRVAYISLPLLLFGIVAGVQPGAIIAHSRVLLAAAIGIEVGALVHIFSDWLWSELK